MNTKKSFATRLVALFCFAAVALTARSQCTAQNTAFQSGETLSYELFFNWKFVWMKAGKATLQTNETTWEGKKAFRSRLVTRTSGFADKHFVMRDTLLSIISEDMIPQYYKKAANEGGKYYVDQVWYTYPQGVTHLQQEYLNRKGETSRATADHTGCVYDMLSMMLRARSFDADKFRVGEKLIFPMADGRRVENVTLIYRGRKNFKMKGEGTTYRCLVFSFVEYEKKKEKEIITFYISDDANHMPVRLDLFLRFGTAKAYLSRSEGLRNPCTSIVK